MNTSQEIAHQISGFHIDRIIDDVWIDVFCFCNVTDFLSIRQCCQHFNDLTNYTISPRMNQYWKLQTKLSYFDCINSDTQCITNAVL